MDINPKIFREYDIRGIVDKDLSLESVEYLGRGIGTYFRAHGKKQAAVGRDARLSSPATSRALCQFGRYGLGWRLSHIRNPS